MLLVDDHADIREAVGLWLERHGFTVVTAADGLEALTTVADHAPDVILMDLSMPVLDGVAATTQLKASPELASIPVIGFTAHAFDTVAARAKDAGMQQVLPKAGLGDLLTAVRAALKQSEG